jgi:hypothetical protein
VLGRASSVRLEIIRPDQVRPGSKDTMAQRANQRDQVTVWFIFDILNFWTVDFGLYESMGSVCLQEL